MNWPLTPSLEIGIAQTGEHYGCRSNESLLAGMLRLGRRGIPVGCVNGGCGVCKVRILTGEVQPIGPISRAHVSLEDERQGYTLACRVAPLTPVRLEVSGKFEKPFCIGFARYRAVPIEPSCTHHTKET